MVCQQWAHIDEARVCIAYSGCRLLAGHMCWEVSHELSLHHVLMLLIACHGQQAVPNALARQAGWQTVKCQLA